MALEGIRAHPDDIVVTVGSQQAVDLVTRVFCDPGDVVLCEAPSYVGALGVFGAYQCDVVHVAMDDDGLVPESLEQAIVAVDAAGKRAKFLYTIPTYHNPAGVTLSTKRRAQVLEICRRHDLLVLEDNPYGLLGFDAEHVQAEKIRARSHHTRQHGSGVRTEHEFFGEICDAIDRVDEALVAGSHTAIADFRHYVEKHRPRTAPRIVGYEVVDHPTDNELVALARRYFLSHDRMKGVTNPF